MTNLAYSSTDSGLEVVIAFNGEAYCTQSSYSRWTGIDRTTVVKRCQSLETTEIEVFEEPVTLFTGIIKTKINAGLTGNKEVVLIPAKIMARWLAKDNPELFDQVISAGATQFLYSMAGYEVKAALPTTLPQTYIEALKSLVESEEAKEQLKLENSILEAQVEDLIEDTERQSEIIDELYDYSSIIRIAKYNDLSEKNYSWRKLKAASKVLGLEIKVAPCQRFGYKNIYSHDAWKAAYPKINLPELSAIISVK